MFHVSILLFCLLSLTSISDICFSLPWLSQRKFQKLWALDSYQILWLLLQQWQLRPHQINWHYVLLARPPTLTPITISYRARPSACYGPPLGQFAPHTGQSSSLHTDGDRMRTIRKKHTVKQWSVTVCICSCCFVIMKIHIHDSLLHTAADHCCDVNRENQW